ncbi:MAG: SRPBCC family protein [Acidobacteriota bacterium]
MPSRTAISNFHDLDAAVRRSFELDRPLGRLAYAMSMLTLGLIHFQGTRFGLEWIGAEPWTLSEYLAPLMGYRHNTFNVPGAFAILGLWTSPFLFAIAVLSVRRARQAGVSTLFVFLLLVPGVNYFLALGLAVTPPAAELEPRPTAGTGPAKFSEVAKAVIAGGFAGGLIFSVAFIGPSSPYGVALFLGAPVAIGLVATLTYNRSERRGTASSHLVSQLALLAGGGTLLLIGVEGGLCLAMVWPLAMPFAMMGSWIGDALVEPGQLKTAHLVVLVLMSPLLVAFESGAPEPAVRAITTEVVIDATPEEVWPNVVAFTELPPPNRFYFKLGIAYPIRARIEGEGVGAVRYCEFSTGPFVEPITRWDEPHRLSFDVVSQPPTMHEWSPYDIHPEHLTESLVSERGEFRLTALDGGRTLLEGTTWYRHDLMPQIYWNLWSDALIHGIHRRVLEHIAARSEGDGAA